MQELEFLVKEKIETWLNGNYDDETKHQIRDLIEKNALTELTDSFYKDLEFGTGGLRGIIGAGSNRINKYTIGVATQGLANYLNNKYPNEKIKVAIAHDSRNKSDYFARITAEVFSANNIYVYFFKELRPTPLLSFAVRELGCKSGVMITASHNPKEYNGYKAYGSDGGQFVAPDDKLVMDEVAKIRSIDEVKFTPKPENIGYLGEEIDNLYIEKILSLSVSSDAIKRQKDLQIVYSPIHGTGITMVPKALAAFGFENVTLVDEQIKPDGNFPTVIYPNPEEKEALTLSLQKAEEIDADLVLATDPDADRVGIAVKNNDDEFILLNGNQTGALLVNYMLEAWENANKFKGNEYITKTIVTSYIIDKIAASKNIPCYNTLTGFKYIGQLMTQHQNDKTFIVGGEESYGYLIGDFVRDKDAVVSCAFIAEMTAYYKDKGSSLYNALIDMYVKYGFYKEKLVSITKKGKTGAEEIKAMMERFRENPPVSLGGSNVVSLKDYELRKDRNLITGEVKDIELPKSDVLQFVTEDGSIISARPSGTEPKIKFYCSINEPLPSRDEYETTDTKLEMKISNIMSDLNV
ncbi:phosphoglucomutase/phosphomannomutase alpha/beta/alpha domain I [Pseudopedobacter saltans DSM 12145]|uniref:Phosphoglucomutase/phosphomannomutase alpha/beta/alpha domain I n=1 Tax=Pseudopedobacter saltans (strain ATCC 51119 / DSM 12145 / JCM 21818 / CCUG 39354 / LMG 10337 / NBRC 100064 / NCIMB 13643) TaxID=762903 RepID=F0S598_PSESL|nr:phospho-sugar mutase [Pseudopedobacter saltans]ADY52043.1 phosphoglucomutase/phosphomannomutase alpha/beta/alpha domain I [Pseudopedobacter saltans DSM 12145]